MAVVRSFRLAEILFVLSCISIVFLSGVAVGVFEIFPFSVLRFGLTSVEQVLQQAGTLTGTRPTEYLSPARYNGEGVTVNDPAGAAPGLTLLAGFFDGGTELRLIRNDGTVVHRWPVRYSALFPNTDYIAPKENVPQSDWNAEIHGALVLPDGSVVFNFNYLGTARVGRCGETQWTLPHMTHHAVTRAADGTFLIPNWRYIAGASKHATVRTPYMEETILNVSPDGQIIGELSVFDILYENNYQGLLARGDASGDIIHVNDVEELTADRAAAFPMFAAGDLMLSMRKGNSILVMDPGTRRIKWYQSGPWRGQHDPDFLPGGKILVFNNNEDGTEAGTLYGGGSIMEANPANSQVAYRYGWRDGEEMYTGSSGKHQALPGGNILVTETRAGRVFEADTNGTIVWEYINRYDASDVAVVSGATRYAESYFTVSDWTCPSRTSR